MDDILDDLIRISRRCKRAAKPFDADPLLSMFSRIEDAIHDLHDAWSGSVLGYHAFVYTTDLECKRPGEHFDSMWGAMDRFSNQTVGEWAEFNYETIRDAVFGRAKVDREAINDAGKVAIEVFTRCKAEVVPSIDALLSENEDKVLADIKTRIAALESHVSGNKVAEAFLPHGKFMSHDMRAIQGGVQIPPHIQIKGWLVQQRSFGTQVFALGELVQQAVTYLQKRYKMKGASVSKNDGPVFVGHGRSTLWKDLKLFLQERLGLEVEEFNSSSVAGKSNKERLLEMLDRCTFAFLVMTAEDEHADTTVHARENVIHEIGLFQGRLSFERAIVLLEDGCQEFSNIQGVGQIRFPRGNIRAKSEEIREVLEREGLL